MQSRITKVYYETIKPLIEQELSEIKSQLQNVAKELHANVDMRKLHVSASRENYDKIIQILGEM